MEICCTISTHRGLHSLYGPADLGKLLESVAQTGDGPLNKGSTEDGVSFGRYPGEETGSAVFQRNGTTRALFRPGTRGRKATA